MHPSHQIADLQSSLGDRYRVERELGAGGMATVYLARDNRHDRRVAIKVLRPELAAIVGAERFLKEIRTTANLQHPHILTLHDSGSANGVVYYVMPYIEGESLRDRLKREKQLPVPDAIRIAREVAAGLEYAHRKGIVHRDIKPENILLHEGDGQAVVADFGIALAVSRSDTASRMTETGMSLGTPQYMSPEQAMGEREITTRSDVYALGCVLYEMLVGEPPFTGHSAQAIFARVLTDEPRSIGPQRRTVPPHVDAAVQTALAKVPADRFASAGEFASALAGGLGPGAVVRPGTAATPAASADERRRRVRLGVLGAIAAVALLATGALASRFSVPDAPLVPPARFSILLPHDRAILGAGPVSTIALSPDGTRIVYPGGGVTGSMLHMRRLDDLVATPLAGTEAGLFPLFSPDGNEIAFVKAGRAYRLALAGGTPTPLGVPAALAGLWAYPDEFLIMGQNGALLRARQDGSSRLVAKPDSARDEAGLLPMQLLPNGKILVLTATAGFLGPIWVLDPDTGERQLVTSSMAGLAWYHDGMMGWVDQGGTIRAREWDLRRGGGESSTAAVTIATNVRFPPGTPPQLWASASGALVYVPAQPTDIVIVDRSGRERVVSASPRTFHGPSVSPDGASIAVDVTDATRDVWQLALHDGTMTRVTFDGDGHDPMWSPDGRSIYYMRARGPTTGISRRAIDGAGASDSVLHDGAQLSLHALTHDGEAGYAVRVTADGAQLDLMRVGLAGTSRRAERFLASPFNESHPAASPDGRWLAYVSEESGRREVYVRSLLDSARVLVSQDGGSEPVWSRDGRELYYRNANASMLVAARLEPSPRLRVRDRTSLFSIANYEPAFPHANYDVTPDGKFVFIRNASLREMVYLQNWTALARGSARRK